MARRQGLWGAIGAAVIVVVAVLLVGSSPGPDTAAKLASAVPTPGLQADSTNPATTASFAPSALATDAPSMAVVSSAAPTAAPNPTPIVRITAAPTLDWAEIGWTQSVRTPVAMGATARVTINGPIGPVCTLQVRYPSGGTTNGGTPSKPKPGSWVWTWTVPGSANTGTATVRTTCTYAGISKFGDASFSILAALPPPTPNPTPAPTWSITGSVNSPVTAYATLTFTGHVNGDPPVGISPIDLSCELVVTNPTLNYSQKVSTQVESRDFTINMTLGAWSPGTYPWKTTCYPTAPGSKAASGTVVIQ